MYESYIEKNNKERRNNNIKNNILLTLIILIIIFCFIYGIYYINSIKNEMKYETVHNLDSLTTKIVVYDEKKYEERYKIYRKYYNKFNIDKIKIGMTAQELIDIMGEPYLKSIYVNKFAKSESFYYPTGLVILIENDKIISYKKSNY